MRRQNIYLFREGLWNGGNCMKSIVVIALFLPPVAVLIEYGHGKQFGQNLLWTLLGFYPGVIHALWLVDPTKSVKNGV